jgi:hypothetical protein
MEGLHALGVEHGGAGRDGPGARRRGSARSTPSGPRRCRKGTRFEEPCSATVRRFPQEATRRSLGTLFRTRQARKKSRSGAQI